MILQQRGNVVIRAITTAVDRPDAKIWEIRLQTDLPDVTVYEATSKVTGDLESVGVLLSARLNSQRADTRYRGPTDLRFEVPDGERWKLFAQCRGIRLQVAAYRGGIL